MRSIFFSLLALLTISLSSASLAVQQTPEEPTEEQIARAIQDLGNRRFTVRESASKYLYQAGARAEPALEKASKSDDAEIASRAKEILERFHWGLYPNQPRELVEQIEAFRSGDVQQRTKALNQLIVLGKAALPTLRKLLSRIEGEEERLQILSLIAEPAKRQAIIQAYRDNYETAAAFLALVCGEGRDADCTDFAAFHYLGGTLAKAIAEYEALRNGPQRTNALFVLTHLYRVKQDWPAARRSAEEYGRPELVESVLWEQQNWAELAKRPEAGGEGNLLGTTAAFHRLAGNKEEFRKRIASLRDRLDGGGGNLQVLREYADAIFLNGEGESVLPLLIRKRILPTFTFDLLVAQYHFRDALAFYDACKNDELEPDERRRLELRRARLLMTIGEKDSAVQLFRKIAGELTDFEEHGSSMREMIRMLVRSGRKELAVEIVGQWLKAYDKRNETPASLPNLLGLLFEKQGESANLWWSILREGYPDLSSFEVLVRLRSLFENPKADEVLKLEQLVVASFTKLEGNSVEQARRLSELADILRRIDRFDDAERLHRQAVQLDPTGAAGLRFGDFLLERDRLRAALAAYEAARDKELVPYTGDLSTPAPVPETLILTTFMLAECKKRFGEVAEAKRLTIKAHLLSLGNEELRGKIAENLLRRSRIVEAKRECDLVLEVGWYRNWYIGNVLNTSARLAVQSREFQRAADCYQRGIVGCLRSGAHYIENGAYLTVPEYINVYRIRALIQAGGYDEAIALADKSLRLLPNNTELMIALVQGLDAAKRSETATSQFRKLFDYHEELLREYPNSAALRNSAAWLAANCNRSLEQAQVHAEKAVELEPTNFGYLDTLAEVHFRKGDRAKAMELMKRCIQGDGNNGYYRRQLTRFEKAPITSDVPEEDD